MVRITPHAGFGACTCTDVNHSGCTRCPTSITMRGPCHGGRYRVRRATAQSRRVSSLSHDRLCQSGPAFLVKLLPKHRCCSCTSLTALIAALFFWSATAYAASFYPVRPADPRAVDFTAQAFGAHAD